MSSLLTYDKLVFRASYTADAHPILDEAGVEVGRVAREGLVVYDRENVPLLSIENLERGRKSFFGFGRSVSPALVVDGRGRAVATLGKRGEITDASGARAGAMKRRWNRLTTYVIEDSTGKEAGRLTCDLGSRGERPMEAATVHITFTGDPTSDLRLAMLGIAAAAVEIFSSQVTSLLERFRVELPS